MEAGGRMGLSSPGKRSCADALKESESRVRALTREVGALREDLRREVKRRERAVTQTEQHEQSASALQRQVQELSYANRKLAAELDTAHDAARAAAQRDRRALHKLREGLTQVEQQVMVRARQGSEILAVVRQRQDGLKRLLLVPPGATVLGSSLVQQVNAIITDTSLALSSLASLLSGPAPSANDSESDQQLVNGTQQHQVVGQEVGQGPAGHTTTTLLGTMHVTMSDAEKDQLRDEVARLRTQLRALVDKAAGAAGAATIELQSLLRDSQAEAVSLKAEVVALKGSLQASTQEADLLRTQVASLQAKLSVHEVAEHHANVAVGELSAIRAASDMQLQSLQTALADVQQAYEASVHENGRLKAHVDSLTQQLHESKARMEAMQASMTEQQADVATAMRLVAQSAAAKGRTAAGTATSATTSSLGAGGTGALGITRPVGFGDPSQRSVTDRITTGGIADLTHTSFTYPSTSGTTFLPRHRPLSATAILPTLPARPATTLPGTPAPARWPSGPYTAHPTPAHPTIPTATALHTMPRPTTRHTEATHPAAFAAAAHHLLRTELDLAGLPQTTQPPQPTFNTSPGPPLTIPTSISQRPGLTWSYPVPATALPGAPPFTGTGAGAAAGPVSMTTLPASEVAAAAAAAAIAARLKAQRIMAEQAAGQATTTAQGSSPTKTRRLSELGDRPMPLAQHWLSTQPAAMSTITATATTFGSSADSASSLSTSLTSHNRDLGAGAGQPSAPALLQGPGQEGVVQSGVAGLSRQIEGAGLPQGGGATSSHMDDLLQEMRNLDEEIVALERSMQAAVVQSKTSSTP